MNLATFEFLGFFAVLILLRSFVRGVSAEKWLLLAASIAFYLSWNVPCVLLILFTSLADYFIVRRMNGTADPASRRRLLQISLVTNLGLLAFFKYSNFFLENLSIALNAAGLQVGTLHYDIILPPAISYFTFASLTYVIDVYYERIAPSESVRDYTLFLTFFPKLLSGPIVRAREFLPQLQKLIRPSAEDFEVGLTYFLIGAVKKQVVADQISPHVNLIFATPGQYDGVTLLWGVLGYTIQIYCDFSGYSDMAIGCARILGFRLPENFQMPFTASTITEFWRRWHMTLSRWFRDYLFLPLEIATRDNPRPVLRASINMMVTMLLCGLWHGASWNFVIWGGIHGAALSIHKIWTTWNPLAALKGSRAISLVWTVISHILTLGVVVLGMVFFRAVTFSDATTYLVRLLTWTHDGTRLGSSYIPAAVAGMVLVHLFVGKDRNIALELQAAGFAPRVFAYSSLLLLLVLLGSGTASPFIYFQF